MAERKEEQIAQTEVNNTQERSRRGEKLTILDRLVPRDRPDHEVESWLEQIEKDPSQIQNQQMAGVATDLKAVQQKIDDLYEIPIDRKGFVAGFKHSIDEATRWLSVFILRIVKKKQGKVKFRQEE